MLADVYSAIETVGAGARLYRVSAGAYDAICMYHSVRPREDRRPGTSDITPAALHSHLAYLDEHFEIVDLPELVDSRAPDRKRVALTFDDGYRDFATTVVPILRTFDAPATAFVVPGFLEGDVRRRQADNAGHVFETLTPDEVHSLVDEPLVTVGNHTRTHHDLGVHHERDILRGEILGGKRALEDRFGVAVDRFCYPRGSYNATSLAIVESSHSLAVRAESRRGVHPDDDRYRLPRVDGGAGLRALKWRTCDLNLPLVREATRRLRPEAHGRPE
jgi:peptidoglycan/xylan/chitin deacetylase (PgdA/CDA1 family)